MDVDTYITRKEIVRVAGLLLPSGEGDLLEGVEIGGVAVNGTVNNAATVARLAVALDEVRDDAAKDGHDPGADEFADLNAELFTDPDESNHWTPVPREDSDPAADRAAALEILRLLIEGFSVTPDELEALTPDQ